MGKRLKGQSPSPELVEVGVGLPSQVSPPHTLEPIIRGAVQAACRCPDSDIQEIGCLLEAPV